MLWKHLIDSDQNNCNFHRLVHSETLYRYVLCVLVQEWTLDNLWIHGYEEKQDNTFKTSNRRAQSHRSEIRPPAEEKTLRTMWFLLAMCSARTTVLTVTKDLGVPKSVCDSPIPKQEIT